MTAKEDPTLVEVKKNIRALLISAPRGLSVEDIEHDYQAVLGKPLPFKRFKCKTALDFFKTMPDVICPTWSNGILILKGIADESSKHIAKLVSRQRVNNSKSRRIFKAPVSTKPLVVPNNFRRNIKELLTVYPNGILGSSLNRTYARHYSEEINFSRLGFRSMSELLNAIQDIATVVKIPRGGYRVVARKSRPTTPTVPKNPLSRVPPSNALPSRSAPPKANSLRATPPNLPRSKNEAPNSTGTYVIPSKCKPLTDLNSLDGNVSVKKEQRKNERVKDLLDSKSGISESTKDELISILVERPNGVWAARLPFEYKNLIGKDLNVLALGFYSIIEMASAMPDIFRIERPFPNGDWLLFLAAKSRKDKNITKIHIPENAVGKGLGYTQQSLPDEIIIELYVTHIRTPDCFWVQLLKFVTELEELQSSMRAFYSSRESAQYMVDDSLIKLGQVCVARFPVDREWYRGLITATPSQLMVEVFYVDYGNTSQVSKSDIRLMKTEFFQLSSQAIKSKLANVKPKLTIWDPTAAHRMNELTANKPLVGFVADKKDDVLNLCICDTTGKDDLYISDLLVNEGLAVFKQDSRTTAPPGFALPEPTQMDINQVINVDTAQNSPTFPDYSTFSVYTGFPNFDFTSLMNMTPAEQVLPEVTEEVTPIIDEEKPTEDDIEFMRQVCEELTDVVKVVVKRLSLPDGKVVHVISFEEKPFVVRSEISALIWDRDILRSKLREVKMVVEKEIISREDHEELFDDLRRLKVGDFASGEEAKEYASLYPLSAVPGILETFNHPSSEVVKIFKDEVAAFEQNPGTYWEVENDSEGTDDSGQSEAGEEHDIEELKLAEQALQFTRKRILRAMASGDLIPRESTVNEADDVEKRLKNIRDMIAKAEAKEAAKDTEGSKESKVEQDDKVVVDSGSVGNVAFPKQQEQPVRPVGITKPEIRQSSTDLNSNALSSITQSSDLLVPNPQHPGIHTSNHQYSNLPTSTAVNLDIAGSTLGIHSCPPQYPDISTSTAPHPDIPRSIPQPTDTPVSSALHPDIPTSNPHNPALDTSTSFYPNPSKPKPALKIPNLMDTPILNPKMNRVNPHSPSVHVGENMNNDVYRSMDQRGPALNQDVFFPVRPGTSVDNQQPYNDFAESVRKTIEKISLESTEKTQQTQEDSEKFNTKKKQRDCSKPSHLPLPYPGPPITGFPFIMPAGHVTPLPHMNFPFPVPNIGPNNVPFQGFVGPFHPLTPPPYHDLGMQFNGPLSGPSFGPPSQLLFKQYGSPFPNAHGKRTQK